MYLRRIMELSDESQETKKVLFPCVKGGMAVLLMDINKKMRLVHLLAGSDGMQLAACSALANKDERKHVGKIIETVALKTGKEERPRKNLRMLAEDKGYDDGSLRNFLKKKGVQPKIPEKMNAEKNGDGQCAAAHHDFKSNEPSLFIAKLWGHIPPLAAQEKCA